MTYPEDLRRIQTALKAASEIFREFTPGAVAAARKNGGDPVTEADRMINTRLLDLLPRPGEGWLSEESVDDRSRLGKRRVWVVDPLDGTREFIAGFPEFCVSIGLVEDGEAVAGGILNPSTQESFLGGWGRGVKLNGADVRVTSPPNPNRATVLVSRSEFKRGQWDEFSKNELSVIAVGSVAYKLARVAAGAADGTATPVPKNEWDICAGVALIRAAGGKTIRFPDRKPPRFNQRETKLPGLVAAGSEFISVLSDMLDRNVRRDRLA